MRKYLLISIVFSFFSFLFGNDISLLDSLQTAKADSIRFSKELEIASENEQTVTDSILVKPVEHGAMTEDDFIVEADSLADFRLKARKEIEKIAENENLSYPLDFVYNEGFHIKTLNEINETIIVNGFSVFQPFRKQDFSIQTYTPHFQAESYGKFIEFDNRNYDLKVPLTITYLGLGDEEMDHAYFSFHKGDLFNLKNLNLETSYLGTSGNWLNVNEKMANINFHLWYKPKVGSIHYYASGINQKSSEERYNFSFNEDRIDEREISHAIAYKSRFLDSGIKFSHTTLDSLESDYQQFYVTAKVEKQDHKLDLTYETFWGDYDFSLIRFKQQSSLFNFHLNSYGFYRDDDVSQISSDLFYRWKSLRFGATYINTDNTKDSKDILLNSSYENSYLRLSFNIGKRSCEDKEWDLFSSKNQLDIPYKNVILRLQNRFENNINAPDDYPEYQSVSTALLIFDMNYSNIIKFGISNHYASNYEVDSLISNADNWDLFLKVQITKYFELYGNFNNIFDKKNMFSQINTVPGRHFTYGVKWIFIN